MYADAEALAARARALVGEAERTGGIGAGAGEELQRTVDALAEAAFQGDEWLSAAAAGAAVGVVDEMARVAALGEWAARAAGRVLQAVPAGLGQISSQGAEPAAACAARVVDACLARLVGACDEAERRMAAGAEDDAAVRLAVACMEGLAAGLERLAAGADGLARAPAVWRAALDGTDAVAAHVTRAFEAAGRLFAQSAGAELRRRQAQGAAALQRAAARVIDVAAAVFGSEAHVTAGDAGRKRALMERFCAGALAMHRAALASPPQFKAVWKALCLVATRFAAPAFDGPALCRRVHAQSCATVRALATQAGALLRRRHGDDLGDPRLQRRVKGMLAFVRFIVFQMPALLARIRTGAGSDDAAAAVAADALPMLDAVFAELTTEHVRAAVPLELAAMVQQLVATVCAKYALALLAPSPQPILRYLDAVERCLCDGGAPREQRLLLIEGVRSAAANRELLRIVAANIGAFSAAHQEALLAHAVPLPMALAVAADCDVASLFAAARGPGAIHAEQQQQIQIAELDQLACAAALCATRLAAPALFGLWEAAALQTLCRAPPGSAGARAVAAAWALLATLPPPPPPAALSTVRGILDAAAAAPARVGPAARPLLRHVTQCFAAACAEGDLAACLADACRRPGPGAAAGLRVLAEVFPWPRYPAPSPVAAAARALLDAAAAALLAPRSPAADRADAAAALAALAPAHQPSDALWPHVHSLLDESLQAAWAPGAEAALLLAAQLPASAGAVSLLELCARAIDSPVFGRAHAAFLLARFAGGFAADPSPPPPLLASLRAVLARLLRDDAPWPVRHQAHTQIIRFATESASQAIVESLVPERQQPALVQFIQRVPCGDSSSSDCEAVYRSVFASLDWRCCPADSPAAPDSHHTATNGHTPPPPPPPPPPPLNGYAADRRILDAAAALRRQLDAAHRTPIPPAAREAVCAELAQLAQAIQRFQRR
ncbi:hypothetical protein H4R18_002839 [Coemansia javaensis]|uniref:Uncharacterized protein n=1 Tax=Coemansia javaensis TaxID=2761396 RepID=A0A9W8HFK7_9FUNG|nr:hypothetical protein H4R18_002839 [Coemansia javaensis]